MQITWAIPCRYGEVVDGLANLLGAGLDVYRPAAVPGRIRVPLTIRLAVPEHELGTQATIEVEILGPGLDPRPGGRLTVTLADRPGRPEDRRPHLLAVVSVTIECERPGQHTVNLRLQERVTSVPIFVEAPTG